MKTVFRCYSALFCRFSLSSEGTRFYFVSVCACCAVTTCHIYFCCLISLRCFFYISYISSISASCYLPPRPAPSSLFGDHIINFFFFENDMVEKNDGMRKKTCSGFCELYWGPRKKSHEWKGRWLWKFSTPCLLLYSLPKWPSSTSTVPSSLESFHPVVPTNNNGNKMARGLEGVKGSVLEGGKCRGSQYIGLLSLASV